MSPEQARGLAVDKRTDIWAFGCVLFEMLSGGRAFGGDTMTDTLARILEREPDWGLLPRNPAAGPQAAATMPSERSRAADAGHRRCSGRARRGAVGSAAGACGRRQAPAVGAGIVAASVILGVSLLAAAWLLGGRPATSSNPLENALFTRFTNFEGTERSAAISPDGRFVAFRSDQNGPLDVWLGQVGTGRFLNLTKGTDDEFATDTPSCGFTADGSEIWLSGGPDRRLRLMPLMGGAPRPFLPDRTVTVAWSHDGARIVYHLQDDGDSMYVADRTGAGARLLYRRKRNEHNHFPVWSPDDRWIYFSSGTPVTKEMDVWRIPAAGGSPERLTELNSDVASLAPIDDRTVLFVSHDQDGSGPWLWSLDPERKLTRRISFGVEKYTSLAATPDGRRLVATVANPAAASGRCRSFPPAWPRSRTPRRFRYPRRIRVHLSSVEALFSISPRSARATASGASIRGRPPRSGRAATAACSRRRRHPGTAAGSRSSCAATENCACTCSRPMAVSSRRWPTPIDVRAAHRGRPTGNGSPSAEPRTAAKGCSRSRSTAADRSAFSRGRRSIPSGRRTASLIAYVGANVSAYAPLLAVRADGHAGRTAADPDAAGRRTDPLHARGRALVYMQGAARAQDFWLLDLDHDENAPADAPDETRHDGNVRRDARRQADRLRSAARQLGYRPDRPAGQRQPG